MTASNRNMFINRILFFVIALSSRVQSDDLDDAIQLLDYNIHPLHIEEIQRMLNGAVIHLSDRTSAFEQHERAQKILNAGNRMLEIVIEEQGTVADLEDLCSSIDFVWKMARSMAMAMVTSKHVHLSGDYISVSGSGPFHYPMIASDLSIHGLSVKLNCDLPFIVVGIHPGKYAQLCLEKTRNATNAQRMSGNGEFRTILLSEIKLVGQIPSECTKLQITMPQSDIELDLYCRETKHIHNVWPRSLGPIKFDECVMTGQRAFYFNETSLEYSENGISDVRWNENTDTVTFTTTTLEGTFGVSEKIEHLEKRDKASHLLFGVIAFGYFLALTMYITDSIFKQIQKHREIEQSTFRIGNGVGVKSSKMPLVIKKCMLAILSGHILYEILLIAYYLLPSEAEDDSPSNHMVTQMVRFYCILPVSFHIWAYSIAVYAWLKSYWSCTGKKSRKQLSRMKVKLIRFNVFQVIIIFAAAVSFSVTFDIDRYTAQYIERAVKVIFAVGTLVVAITFLAAGAEMVKHVVYTAKRARRGWCRTTVRKLRISGLLIALCLLTFVVSTFIWAWTPALWNIWNAQMELVLKGSDIACYFIIVYLFSMKTARERETMRSKMRKKQTGFNMRSFALESISNTGKGSYLGVATRESGYSSGGWSDVSTEIPVNHFDVLCPSSTRNSIPQMTPPPAPFIHSRTRISNTNTLSDFTVCHERS